MRIAVDDV